MCAPLSRFKGFCFATLTTREREGLKTLAEGNSAQEIAWDLNLSVKTVEAHKRIDRIVPPAKEKWKEKWIDSIAGLR